MPTLSIYVTDVLYRELLSEGKPSKIGKEWIEAEYQRRNGEETK